MAGKKKSEVKCNDKKCPFHGNAKLRGRTLKGIVIASDVYRSATIKNERMFYIKKYERYEKRRTKLRAHNPPCINAKKGDLVMVKECRPLSKTKHFIVIKKTSHDYLFKEKEKALEESKVKKEAKKEEKEEEKQKENKNAGS